MAKLVKSNYTKKQWVEDSKGKRLTAKFKLLSKEECGPYTMLKTSNGTYAYHENLDELVFWTKNDTVYFIKITDKIYRLDWNKGYNYFCRAYYDNGARIKDVTHIFKISNGLIKFELEEKYYGYMDENANVVIEPKWSDATNFNEYGYAVVSKDDKNAIIDKAGSYVLQLSDYYGIEFFKKDLLIVTKDGKRGVITLEGKEVIPIFYACITVSGNYLLLCKNGKRGLADSNGKIIFECIYPEIIETPDKFVVQDFVKKEELKKEFKK